MKDTLTSRIKRGQESWNYFYVGLGFAVAIEGSVIQMAKPLDFPVNEIAFFVVALLTGYLFLANGWFQNKLIGLKSWYENIER